MAVAMNSDGMAEMAELAAMLAAYRRLQERINDQCASYKVVHLAALAENLRRLHTQSGSLAEALDRRLVLMTW